MSDRRDFLKASLLGASAFALSSTLPAQGAPLPKAKATGVARVISTWDFGVAANQAAWAVLSKGGHALDAVEQGVQVPESDLKNHSVGRAGYPDRDGHVTLDASIMDADGNCGAVAALEHIAHPISVASGCAPRRAASAFDISTMADAPVLSPGALPAVTVELP